MGLEAIAPDDFLLDQLDLASALTVQVVRAQAAATGTPPHPRVPVELRDRLHAVAEQRGVNTSELVREALHRYLAS